MTEPTVWVFFYGSFINRDVLARAGYVPKQIIPARLDGYRFVAETLANLEKQEAASTYGVLCPASESEITELYDQDWVRGAYFPRPVMVEDERGYQVMALCYIAARTPPGSPSADYLDLILAPAREYSFPSWYIERIESFRNR